MGKLTEEAINCINELKVAQVATASKAGKPNVSAKGSMRVMDADHLVFANFKSPRTVANLKENPQISAIFLNPATRKGCRVWGKAEVVTSGDMVDKLNAEFAVKNMKCNEAVVVAVDECITF